MLCLSERKKILDQCLNHSTNTFYTSLYSGRNTELNSETDWHALPILTKQDLIDHPLEERSFLPIKQLDHVRASSGTSGKPPLFSPRTHVRNLEYRLTHHDFKGGFLAFGVPLMPHWHEMLQEEQGIAPKVVTFDPRFPEISVHLAESMGVRGISLFLYQVESVGEEMKKSGINTHIELLEVTGEMCSQATYRYMRETFPNATILQSYGASEVEDVHIGIPCKPMDGTEPLAVYHAKPTHFLEIVDPDTHEHIEPVPGAEGDLLITAYPGEPSAFPLVRFQIGDTIRVIQNECEHGSFAFTVLGRTDLDFLKISGGVIRADEIERVLKNLENVRDQFELHRYIETKGAQTNIRIELHLDTPRTDMEELARVISAKLRISPTRVLADVVSEKQASPLTCLHLDTTQKGKKRQRITSHNN